MANKTQTIRIESILGGHSPTTHFGNPGEYQTSLGIDPSLSAALNANGRSGLLRPTRTAQIGASIGQAPFWQVTNPKDSAIYVYCNGGSMFSLTDFAASGTITNISDAGNESGTSTGNGCAYYDNYIYFAKNTTIARYGPLNGTPSLNGDYWGTTLSKTALTHTTYPRTSGILFTFPNHYLHRHSDGKLYIADVVDNQGTIHFIKTRKTTVEGDTDDGSTYDKVNLGYGLWPTAMESYGEQLVIAFYEGSVTNYRQTPAKIAFWDTTSESVNQITWVEFPDGIVSALKNVNGVLYAVSGNPEQIGMRISKYVGGNSFEQVKSIEYASISLPGSIASASNRLFFGSYVESYPQSSSVVYALGFPGVSDSSLFAIQAPLQGSSIVTSLSLPNRTRFSWQHPIMGYATASNDGYLAIGETGSNSNYGTGTDQTFWSSIFKIGAPFKVTKIRIPLAQVLSSSMTVIPYLYFDSGTSIKTLTTINSTNYGTRTKMIVLRPENATGDSDFFLSFEWSGASLCTISLPITIEYELLDVDTTNP